jgi:hypothetical protein
MYFRFYTGSSEIYYLTSASGTSTYLVAMGEFRVRGGCQGNERKTISAARPPPDASRRQHPRRHPPSSHGDCRQPQTTAGRVRRVRGKRRMHGRLADPQNMAVEQKRLAYNEAVWAVKEIDLIEDNRKLQMRIGSSTIKPAH